MLSLFNGARAANCFVALHHLIAVSAAELSSLDGCSLLLLQSVDIVVELINVNFSVQLGRFWSQLPLLVSSLHTVMS